MATLQSHVSTSQPKNYHYVVHIAVYRYIHVDMYAHVHVHVHVWKNIGVALVGRICTSSVPEPSTPFHHTPIWTHPPCVMSPCVMSHECKILT